MTIRLYYVVEIQRNNEGTYQHGPFSSYPDAEDARLVHAYKADKLKVVYHELEMIVVK